MLDSLHDAVRRQYVDDADVVHRAERLILLVRRAEPALVLVKQEVLPVAGVLLGQDTVIDASQVRVRVPVYGAPHDVGLFHLDGGGGGGGSRAPAVQLPVCVRLRRHVDVGRRKDAQRVAPDIVAVSALHVVYPN